MKDEKEYQATRLATKQTAIEKFTSFRVQSSQALFGVQHGLEDAATHFLTQANRAQDEEEAREWGKLMAL